MSLLPRRYVMSASPAKSEPLQADHDQIEQFVSVLFRYAAESTFASLRAFDQFDAKQPPFLTKAVAISANLSPLITTSALAAQRCANHNRPIVFAPPIATFSNPDRARGVDLANGLALSVEIDDADPETARTWLEEILGPVTVAVESGSFWINSTMGECKPKLHLHWRLSEPTLEVEDHGKLRQARNLAALLVGADPTGKPIVHPLRWSGSWNCKSTPRIAKISILNEKAEIHLDDALERLTEAVEAAGLQQADIPRGPSGPPQAPAELVQSAMRAIPNPGTDVHYDDWIKFGYAAYRATGGSEEGFGLWDQWSRKSEKYNAAETTAAWLRIKSAIDGSNAPRTVGAGTVFYYAGQAGWRRPEKPKPEPDRRRKETAVWHSGCCEWVCQAKRYCRFCMSKTNGAASPYRPM